MSPVLVVAVAVAGGAGALVRALADQLIGQPDGWPLSTLVVNGLGSLALGVAVAQGLDESTMTVVATGATGGATSFSTAAVQTQAGPRRAAVAAAHLLAALAGAAAGLALG